MTYDQWKQREPTPDPGPTEHRPYDEECPCGECVDERHGPKESDVTNDLDTMSKQQLLGLLLHGVCKHASNPWGLCNECETKIRERLEGLQRV